jgi:DNA primase
MKEQKTIPIDEIQALKARVDLRAVASQFVELRGTREQYGSCPRCGGEDRFHVQRDQFFCRQCRPPEAGQGKHDVYDFAQFVGLAQEFREAYRVVAAWAQALPSPVRPVSTPAAPVVYTSPTWQTRAQQEVERCVQRLFSPKGEAGQTYLSGRRLRPATVHAARLGLALRRDGEGAWQPAIALPWFYAGQITAIQYRFLASQAQRYTRFSHAQYYGETVLYTLPRRDSDTLVVVEGELNALSVWQETPYDVVSVGSQSVTSKTKQALQHTVERYERVVVWTDQPQVALDLITAWARPASMILSAQDANEWLQRNELRRVII